MLVDYGLICIRFRPVPLAVSASACSRFGWLTVRFETLLWSRLAPLATDHSGLRRARSPFRAT